MSRKARHDGERAYNALFSRVYLPAVITTTADGAKCRYGIRTTAKIIATASCGARKNNRKKRDFKKFFHDGVRAVS